MLIVLMGLFFALGGLHMFINAKKIVPPERDPSWWVQARLVSPLAVVAGVALVWWALSVQLHSMLGE